ncbi:hypothetical protein V8B97DRAFT_1920738 [Scleroderma yunnanense]
MIVAVSMWMLLAGAGVMVMRLVVMVMGGGGHAVWVPAGMLIGALYGICRVKAIMLCEHMCMKLVNETKKRHTGGWGNHAVWMYFYEDVVSELVVASSLLSLIDGVVNGGDGHEVVMAQNGGLEVEMDLGTLGKAQDLEEFCEVTLCNTMLSCTVLAQAKPKNYFYYAVEVLW